MRYLTGITTSGTPHLGNYVGSIRPSVQISRHSTAENFYFLADYHALIKTADPARIQRSTLEIAASWLAAGLNPEQVTFYRQSDIPEIPELTWLLSCVSGKGLLNRAHAYKAVVDKNNAAGNDPDTDVSVGLFMYPVLMAADILLFNAHKIPVGRDQIQHIEMARAIAQSFNHRYGEHFITPQAVVEDTVSTLPGLDGRKMSKSYDNTIPLFAPRDQLRKLIFSIVTDSRAPGEPKDTQNSAIFQIYRAFANAQETQALEHAYAHGIAWADAKQLLFERIEGEIAPIRQRYEALREEPSHLGAILLAGAEKARKIATPFMHELRSAVGLRSLHTVPQKVAPGKVHKTHTTAFKQYREKDGKFYFKLVDAQGTVVLQSLGFDSPNAAGQSIALLQREGIKALSSLQNRLVTLSAHEHEKAAAVLANLVTPG